MNKVTAKGSDSSPGRGRTTYHKDIITLHINSISLKLSKVNVIGESEQNLNIAMSPLKSRNLKEVYTKMKKWTL